MNTKPKVLVITDFYYPHWTGISKAIYNMTDVLKKDFDFTVLTVQFDKKLKKSEVVNDIPVIRSPFIFSISRAKYSLSIIAQSWQAIQKNDIVFINSPNTNILFFSLIAKLFGKRLVVFHQGDLILPKRTIPSVLLEKVFDISSYISLSLADGTSTYTKDYAEHSRILKPFLHKFTPLLMPFLLPNTKASSSEKLEIVHTLRKKHVTIIGFAGRFVAEKGFDILFKAIPLLKSKKPVMFAFAGETKMAYEDTFAEYQPLLEAVKDRIIFLGLLNEEELSTYYKLTDFFVIPSRSDCFPLVQAEAALSKKPIVVADIPGARMLVKETGFGRIFEAENPAELAKAIDIVLENPAAFEDNYSKVLQMLNIPTNAQKIAHYLTGRN